MHTLFSADNIFLRPERKDRLAIEVDVTRRRQHPSRRALREVDADDGARHVRASRSRQVSQPGSGLVTRPSLDAVHGAPPQTVPIILCDQSHGQVW